MPDGFSFEEALKPEAPSTSREDAPRDYYSRNKAWMKPGSRNFYTDLSDDEEKKFQAWVKANKVPNDDSAQADYDMRGLWKASQDPAQWKQLQTEGKIPPDMDPASSKIDPNDGKPHWPDYWKTPYHETFSGESKWADPAKAPKWNDKDQLVMPDGKVLFDDRAQNKPAEPEGFSFDDAVNPAKKPTKDDGLPWDVPMTGEQMRRAQEQTKKGDEALVGSPHGILNVAQRAGQQLLGERPFPTPVEALEAASLGVGLMRPVPLVAAARTAAGLASRIEPTLPGGGPAPQPPTSPATPQPTVDLGGIPVSEGQPPPSSVPTASPPVPGRPPQSGSLAEAGIAPEAATGTETIAVPQGNGTATQVQVQTGARPPAEAPPPAETGTIPETVSQQPWTGARPPEAPASLQEAGITPTAEPAPAKTPTATDPWAPVATAPVEQPQAETPVATEAPTAPEPSTAAPEQAPSATAPPVAAPVEVPASDLKPGDKVMLGDKEHEVEAVRPWTGDEVGIKLVGDPKLHTGPADAPVQKVPEPTPEPTPEEQAMQPVQAFGGPWSPVPNKDGKPGKNDQGQVVYQNENGARATLEDGIPHTESVTEHPERGLVSKAPDSRKSQFLIEGEKAATEEKPVAAKRRHASPSRAVPDLAVPSRDTPRPASNEENIPEATPSPKPVPEKEGGISEAAPMAAPPITQKPEPESGITPTTLPATSPEAKPEATKAEETAQTSEEIMRDVAAELTGEESHKTAAKRPSTPYIREPKEPKRLVQFLREPAVLQRGTIHERTIPGGVRDIGGDLKAAIGTKGRPGLINNKTGRTLDDAALNAWQAGYFPEHDQRPDINDLLNAIRDDHEGRARYSMHDQEAVDAYHHALGQNQEISRLASLYGIPADGLTHDQFLDALTDQLSQDELANELTRQAAYHEALRDEFETAAKEWVAVEPKDWNPDQFHGSDQSRSLEDLENEYRQEIAAAGSRQRDGGDQQSGPAGSPAGEGAEAAGLSGNTTRPSGRDTAKGGTTETDLLGKPITASTTRTSEPTIRNDPNQVVMPGMGPSAVQAQAARDQAGRGGLMASAPQDKATEGLFAPKEAEQPELIEATSEPPAEVPSIVTHVTKKGKPLTGTIRTDLDRASAQALDPYTFKKDDGWFIRAEANARPVADQTPTGEPAAALEADPDAEAFAAAKKREKQASWLRDVASKLESDAEADAGRDRRSGTARQARMAASAVNDANTRLQTASTMQNLADGMERGEIQHLSNIGTRTQVEQLDHLLRQSRYARMRAESVSYGDEQKLKDAPFTDADIRYASLPSVYIHPAWAKDAAIAIEGNAPKGNSAIIRWLKDVSTVGARDARPGPEKVEQLRAALVAVRKKTAKLPYQLSRIAETLADRDRITKLGITNDAELQAALREFNEYRGARREESAIAKAERALIGQKPGVDFFPTPKALVDRLVEEANIKPGMRVLEPSAGKGDIADAAREAGATVDTVELSSTLRDILTVKGHNLVGQDFMEFQPTEGYDRIVMNPPFSNNLDAVHIQRAYQMLRPGGRMVAITGEGVHFRTDKVASAFRDWLFERGAEIEKLPEGGFKSAFRPTGVATRIVIVDKPSDAAATEDKP